MAGDALSYVTKRHDDTEEDIWYTLHLDIFRWDLDKDGDRIKYVVYEDDKGKKTTREHGLEVDLKIFGISLIIDNSVEIEMTRGDDLVGESIVDYCNVFTEDYRPSNTLIFYSREN